MERAISDHFDPTGIFEPALKMAHFDLSGDFGRSNRNVDPFHLRKLLSPGRSFVSC